MYEDGFSNNSSLLLMTSGNTKSLREKLQETKDLNYSAKVDTIIENFEKECEYAIEKGRDVVYFTIILPESNTSFVSKDVIEEFGRRLAVEGFGFKVAVVDEGTKYLYEIKLNLKS